VIPLTAIILWLPARWMTIILSCPFQDRGRRTLPCRGAMPVAGFEAIQRPAPAAPAMIVAVTETRAIRPVRVVQIRRGLPGLYPLKGDAFLAEQRAQPLVADVVDHPLGDQELRQLGQAPRRERQAMLGWPGLGDLLDLPPLGQGELRLRRRGGSRERRTRAVPSLSPSAQSGRSPRA
jgi:hypothetical protein